MGKNFSVEIRNNCKICGGELPTKRHRSYCSKKCRDKYHRMKMVKSGYVREYQRRQSGKYAQGKLQCLVCGKWYIQVGSHVQAIHELSAREYREEYELPLSKGVVPAWYRKLKGEQALENETYKNLEKGLHMRYKKGDPRAKVMTGQKGKYGNQGYPKTEFYG